VNSQLSNFITRKGWEIVWLHELRSATSLGEIAPESNQDKREEPSSIGADF
jgi:hypothetical protein